MVKSIVDLKLFIEEFSGIDNQISIRESTWTYISNFLEVYSVVEASLNKFESEQLLLSGFYFEWKQLIYNVQKINLDIADDLVFNLKKR